MAYRVTELEVREIIDVDALITDIEPFIIPANLIVTNMLGSDTTVDASTLKEIERYLTAHFITCRDPRATEERAGDVSVKYAYTYGDGLKSTQYGQMVLLLDHTGTMAKTGKKRASINFIDYSVTE